MPDNLNEKILLVGAGAMAVDYFKVLEKMGREVVVVGRSVKSARGFYDHTGIMPVTGGIEKFISDNKIIYSKAIIAVGVEELRKTGFLLIEKSYKDILIEKPGGSNFREINDLARHTEMKNAKVYVAYNRRFYASVLKAKEIISRDGGVSSFSFEFTEWSHVIEKLEKAKGVKENWFLANSTHVIDMAFFLGGIPRQISTFTSGKLKWHPKASVFAGAGVSENNALFSYQANWEAPGRWGVEIMTRNHRLILRPLEKLQIQKIGEIKSEFVELDESYEKEYKPGLYLQVKNFLDDSDSSLLSIVKHAENCKIYEQMLG